jgi:hypothetical protein
MASPVIDHTGGPGTRFVHPAPGQVRDTAGDRRRAVFAAVLSRGVVLRNLVRRHHGARVLSARAGEAPRFQLPER